jgi:60 kDa SS-A/Ro ribonucleoprotein
MNGGGTTCSVALQRLNTTYWEGDLVIYVSDNMSWGEFHRQSNMNDEWKGFKKRNPKAKLVLIDIQPYQGHQVKDSKDVLNIGGFTDSVFEVIKQFVEGDGDHFVDIVNKVEI